MYSIPVIVAVTLLGLVFVVVLFFLGGNPRRTTSQTTGKFTEFRIQKPS